MKRFLAGFALALLIFPATVAAGLVNVHTPMTQNLDGGGYSITNAANVGATTLSILSLGNSGIYFSDGPRVSTGNIDPSLLGQAGYPAGSVFIDNMGAGVWYKAGPNASDWHRLAFAP